MSASQAKFPLPTRYKNHKSLWVEYADLAAEYKPVDLGSGFPNFPPPQYVKDALLQAAGSSNDQIYQYTRGAGHPRLVSALAKLYSGLVGRQIDPYKEIVVTLGGYHALFLSIMAIVAPGDEVIIMEPFFEAFEHNVQTAGGVPRYTALRIDPGLDSPTSDDWILDFEHLESLFNDRTKAIIVNNPHNPLGKVFTYQELDRIARLCHKWDVVCISDEVYEWLTYDSRKHVRMASLPGMFDRTVTVSSAGKVFGVTGFKLGWVYGPSYLVGNLQLVHFDCVRAANTFLQEAVAICFETELRRLGSADSYFISLPKQCELKRNFLFQSLKQAGFKPILSAGGYFIVAEWSPLEPSADLSEEVDEYKDFRFTKWLTKKVGLQGIPVTPFFHQEHKHLGENLVRFCFVKTDAYLEKAARVLKEMNFR